MRGIDAECLNRRWLRSMVPEHVETFFAQLETWAADYVGRTGLTLYEIEFIIGEASVE